MKIESYSPEFDKLIDPHAKIETIAEGFIFTEGPIWDHAHKCLLFSDIPADTIYSWSSKQGVSTYRKPSSFSDGLTFDEDGGLIACEHRGRCISCECEDGKVNILVDSFNGKKLNSPNDVVAAKDGSILFTDPIYGLRPGNGGPAEQELDFQGVYRLLPDRKQLELISKDFERPNGLVFSPDEKYLYVDDTVRQHIRRFELQPDWKVTGGQVWAELWDDNYAARPDGMKVDINGNLFSTGPGGLWIFNPQAELLGRIFLPNKTSNLNWGDDDRRSLYITSSSTVLRIRCKTRG